MWTKKCVTGIKAHSFAENLSAWKANVTYSLIFIDRQMLLSILIGALSLIDKYFVWNFLKNEHGTTQSRCYWIVWNRNHEIMLSFIGWQIDLWPINVDKLVNEFRHMKSQTQAKCHVNMELLKYLIGLYYYLLNRYFISITN